MIKTSNQNSNRIVGISSDDFFHLNTKKDNKKKDDKSKKNNKQTRKNLSVEKPKKFVNKKESNKQKTTSNSKSLKLPDVFFEQILEYELQLKLKFDPKVFFELINLYSSAIKFYESIKNDKFITYNLGLNMLFAMPEVKSFMDGEKNLTKTEKKENIEKKMQQSEQKITKDKIETMYQSRINKNKKGKNIIKDDFNKQQMSFKKRMEAKKKKYLSSLSIGPIEEEDNTSSSKNDTKINTRNKKGNNKYRNKSVDIVKPKRMDDESFNDNNNEEIIDAKKFEKFIAKKSIQLNVNFSIDKNNFFEENEKEEIRNDINKLSFSGSGTDSEKDTLSFTTSDNMIIDLSKKHKFTNKTLFKEKLKVNFDVYICQYYNKFIENTMNDILDDYGKCGEEFEKKLYDNSIEFFNQKKELESLLKIDDEDNTNYNDQIKKAVEELKKEEDDERDKILEEGSDKVDKLNEKYDNIKKLNDDHYLDIIKEKLKLDVMKSLNSYVFK